jgi:hypothetical protein
MGSKVSEMDETSREDPDKGYATTDEDRRRIIERARRELPQLDREYESASKEAYRRAGIPPLPHWSKD